MAQLGEKMTGRREIVRMLGVAVAAMLLAAGLPSAVQAAWIGLQNGVKGNVVVVITTIANNVSATDKPRSMFAGEVTWMPVAGPCAKIIEIYDPTGKVLLYSNRAKPHACGNADEFFVIVPAVGGMVNVVPGRPPTPPPGR
jgi:hypothetical protein